MIRIPIKGWMAIPNTRSLDPGSDDKINPKDCQVKKPLVIQGFNPMFKGWKTSDDKANPEWWLEDYFPFGMASN